ncbi:unnamed protein product [Brassica oleracea var. botrytis]|uniref:(rape) hypothetical protein n=1 Tax=Brassica napus TaxID=3708 RepID=A0A816IDK9_BRANA|nr:unnamed protein product [Brassica napus]
MKIVQSDPVQDPETRYLPRCCSCFPTFRSRSSTYSSWGRIRTVDDNHSVDHGDEPPWWKRAALMIRECEKFQYDPLSYSLNFDADDDDEYVGLGGFRSFSTRYASVPVSSGKSPASSTALTPHNEILES